MKDEEIQYAVLESLDRIEQAARAREGPNIMKERINDGQY